MLIGITDEEQKIIIDILDKYKEYLFYFYGSRVKGTYEKTSDLDILIKGKQEMPLVILEEIKQTFDESKLPYVVNFSDYHSINKDFYKRIEKDLFPYNWKECKIENLNIQIIDGDRGKNYPNKQELLDNGDCLFLSAQNVTKNGFNFNETQWITKERDNLLRNGKLVYGDIVITTRGTVGNVALYSKDIKYESIRINSGMLIVRCGEGIFNEYIYYVLSSQMFAKKIASMQTGTAQPQLPKSHFQKMEILLPSFETQKKIAKVLSAIDDKIELNNSINNNLEQQAQAIYKSWFIDIKEANNYSEKFGNLPKNATISRIADIDMIVTDYVANGSFASLKENVTLYQEPNYAYFVRNTDLKSNTFNVYVDEHSYKFLSKSVLHGNEIIISNVGDVGSVYLCPKLDKPMTLGNNIIMLRPNKSEILYYLYIWFKWSYGQGLIQGIKGGSAQPKFNKTDFKSLPIILPSDDMLNNFSQIVAPMFKIIENNYRENTRLIQLRDTLLPKLMSGEIDVDKVEV